MKTKIFLSLLISFLTCQTWALELKYQGNDVVAYLLQEAVNVLPPLVHERLKSDRLSVKLVDGPTNIIASVSSEENKIYLNRSILKFRQQDLETISPNSWLGTDKNKEIKTKHSSLKNLLVGAIAHEIMHYYDEKGFPHLEYLKSRKQCIYAAASHTRDYEPECQMIQNVKLTVSDSPEFLQLAGFPKRGLFISENEAINSQQQRSPDAYEYTSPAEAFAVNMEFFLLDQEYKCRRPLLYNYFVGQFKYVPFSQSQCNVGHRVLVQHSNPTTFAEQWEDLDLSKLYQIHYLWAGPGHESFSRFGHAMIRLVFCAKNRQTVGPECLNDVYAHRVISFRAAVDDFKISTLKGIVGDYPSYLYFLSFSDVNQEYTRTELRPLYSLPLKLTPNEMEKVVLAALEGHWSYKGTYKFLSNNCATETLNLLQTALINRPKVLAMQSIRPDHLYNDLIDIGLADSKYELENLAKQFPSLESNSQLRLFNNNLNVLATAGLVPHNISLEEYLQLSIDNRTSMAKAIIQNKSGRYKKRELYALLNIAEYNFDNLVAATLKKHLLEFTTHLRQNSSGVTMDQTQLTGLLKQMVSANQLVSLDSSYGIPLESEEDSINMDQIEQRFQNTKAMITKLLMAFRDFVPNDERQKLGQEEEFVIKLRNALPSYKF
ncbi:MAG: DUF7844 domain-containing protein [Bdellovibrio sp.]